MADPITPDLPDLERPLTDKERRRYLLGPAVASPFDTHDRLFPSFESSGVYDHGQEDARELKQMLKRDGRVRQLENVLTLPVRSVVPEIRDRPGRAGKKAGDLVRANVGPMIRRLVAQGTSAQIFRKAFFEGTWEQDGTGVGWADIAYRPPATCQARFEPRTGKPAGFRQQVVAPDGRIIIGRDDEEPGWKIVPQSRAVIFTHGTHREPISGVSELDVALWCWESRQKVLFLLFQFLEGQALPKPIVYGPDAATAQANADYVARAKSSGVIPMIRQGGQSAGAGERFFDLLESSGQGHQQFLECVRYLEEQQVQSVLAGFMQLTETSKSGGSFAMSHDQREFFLQAQQAKADELSDQVRDEVFRPLVAYNLGTPDDAPDLSIGPLSQVETGRALELLNTLSTATTVNTPWEFVDELVKTTATYLGLDEELITKAVEEHAEEREAKEAEAEAMAAAIGGLTPGMPGMPPGAAPGAGGAPGAAPNLAGAPPAGPNNPAAGPRAAVGDGIDTAFELVRRAQLGQDPVDAARAMTAPERHRGPNPGGALPEETADETD